MRIRPTKAFFRPGELVTLQVDFDQPVQTPILATVYHLGESVAVWQTVGHGTAAALQGEVLAGTPRGYLVHIRVGEQEAFTAFDVLDHWTQAPRYGYLYDFRPNRPAEDMEATLDHLMNLHVNGLQFYDWQYRHDSLLPPQEEFIDPLGRALSLKTIRALKNGARQRNMASMLYAAIYAASPQFAAAHPTWELYDAQGQPIDFAGGFLKLMNMNSTWQKHFVSLCFNALTVLQVDGIHVDQYGEPTSGFDFAGKPVDIPGGFAETLATLRTALPPKAALLFNLVHNYPADIVAKSPLNFWYSELWPPDTQLTRLWRTIRDNRRLNKRPAVLAVYIPPEWEETVIAAHSTILAAGGTQIAHGEHGSYLSDPYFPKAGTPSPALAERLKKLADFAVAYEEALIFAEDVTENWAQHITVNGETLVPGRIIIHAAGKCLYVNLLNASENLTPRPPLHGDREGESHTVDRRWDEQLLPVAQRYNVEISLAVQGIRRCWWASPDEPLAHYATPEAESLRLGEKSLLKQAQYRSQEPEVSLTGYLTQKPTPESPDPLSTASLGGKREKTGRAHFTVPLWNEWLLVCLEFEDAPSCPT